MWVPRSLVLGLVASSLLVACGGEDDPTETVVGGITVPAGARGQAAELVRDALETKAEAAKVDGPDDIECAAVANVRQRPIDRQYDHVCTVTFPNGRSMECIVPALSHGELECEPALFSEAPFPAIYQDNSD